MTGRVTLTGSGSSRAGVPLEGSAAVKISRQARRKATITSFREIMLLVSAEDQVDVKAIDEDECVDASTRSVTQPVHTHKFGDADIDVHMVQ